MIVTGNTDLVQKKRRIIISPLILHKLTIYNCFYIPNYPSSGPYIQVIDYYLWALQRLYEKHEDRYFVYIKDKFERIIDVDDKRFKPYGVYYDRRNEITVDKIKDSLKG